MGDDVPIEARVARRLPVVMGHWWVLIVFVGLCFLGMLVGVATGPWAPGTWRWGAGIGIAGFVGIGAVVGSIELRRALTVRRSDGRVCPWCMTPLAGEGIVRCAGCRSPVDVRAARAHLLRMYAGRDAPTALPPERQPMPGWVGFCLFLCLGSVLLCTVLTVPWWVGIPPMIGVIGLAAWVTMMHRSRLRTARWNLGNVCGSCLYPLDTASGPGRCAECGAEYEDAAAVRWAWARLARHGPVMPAFAVSLALFLVPTGLLGQAGVPLPFLAWLGGLIAVVGGVTGVVALREHRELDRARASSYFMCPRCGGMLAKVATDDTVGAFCEGCGWQHPSAVDARRWWLVQCGNEPAEAAAAAHHRAHPADQPVGRSGPTASHGGSSHPPGAYAGSRRA